MGRAKLAAHGIRAFVTDEHLSTLNPQYMAAAGGVRLQVRRADETHAQEILNEPVPEEDEDDDIEDGPPCPRCGKRYAYRGLPGWHTLVAVLLLGIPFLFLKKQWICGKCHHPFGTPDGPASRAHPYRVPRDAARSKR